MAFTVTATGSGAGAFRGVFLQVVVIDGGTEAGGNQVASLSASGAIPEFSFTPNGSSSLLLFSLSADNPGSSSFTAAANNTIISTGFFSGDDWLTGFGNYNSTVTSGTPVTIGGTPVSSDYTTWASYEILASVGGVTPTSDASTPALVNTTTALTISTASFNPPGGTVLAALVVVGGTGSSATIACGITDSSGLGLTWTKRSNDTSNLDQSTFVFTTTMPGGSVPVFPVTSLIQPVSVVTGRRGWQGANHSR